MRLGITEYIDCAHFLPGHPKCGQVHGHTYKVEVVIEGEKKKERAEKPKEVKPAPADDDEIF